MAEQHLITMPAAADPSAWLRRIVYQSDANEVSLCNTPATQIPLGVVTRVFADDATNYRVQVCVGGPCLVDVADGGLTAGTHFFITGDDDPDAAAADGKATAATAGDYYVGFAYLTVDAAENSQIMINVSPGQLSIAAE